nr:AAA family ATPase [Mycolicibacter longobardus]
MTVLFADVVHSMDIAAAVGAERLREIMAQLFDRCAAVVRRYGGTLDKFTGDGIMAVFGAPVSLEDHAYRGCLAALEIQAVQDVALQLRIGLNSGEVVAGEIGSGPGSYTAIGEQVGMAQRMESVAPPGGVMLSASTARLVEDVAVLGEPELVRIKGAVEPVRVRRLLGLARDSGVCGRAESRLVGRRWEMTAVAGMLERAVDGAGGVVGVVGPPGIGKSRLAREVGAIAAGRGVEVVTAVCEAHARDIPFHVVAALLRAATGVADLDRSAARQELRARFVDADEQDLLLFDDLLGIADPGVNPMQIAPDARRRRLTALVGTTALARTSPRVYVIEDAHWIDDVSESMLADFMAVIPRTRSLVVITYRPEYRGALSRLAGAQKISLAPLPDSESAVLITELLGRDSSVVPLVGVIAERTAGNPFFAQEIVRDLAERGVLQGPRGGYRLREAPEAVSVPATLQATIAARIDRLAPAAKQTLRAASVIGSQFGAELLTDLGIDPLFDELVQTELIEQVRFTPRAEYAFHHPLVRTVAYESQLKADRAVLHRRLGAVIEAHDPAAADANAALIAEHLEAAGDSRAAYAWHMRAGAWSTNRDISAAQASWERARLIADALAEDGPDRQAMRIAPRTLICASGFRSGIAVGGARFDELQQLCSAAGDKASLAVAMAGLVGEHYFHDRIRAASQAASEQMALLESIGDPMLIVGLAWTGMVAKIGTGEMTDVLRWSQQVIDLADGDPTKGNFVVGSPLALAWAARGLARWTLGRDGWREDFDRAIAEARSADPLSYAICVAFTYSLAILGGALSVDDNVRWEIDQALSVAERSADDTTLGIARRCQITALLHQDPPDDERALELLAQFREMCAQGRFSLSELRVADTWTGLALGRRGDHDQAIPLVRGALDNSFAAGQLGYCTTATGVLGTLLVERGHSGDLDEAQGVIDRLAAAPLPDDFVLRDLTLLRLRALLAQARGDAGGYRGFADRYRELAAELGFEGHLAAAEAMT